MSTPTAATPSAVPTPPVKPESSNSKPVVPNSKPRVWFKDLQTGERKERKID